MKSSSLYRLEVAPLIILPLGRSPLFSYSADKSVPLGSLVSISFGKRSLEGVVFGCAPLSGKAPAWMKSITKIIEKQFLTEKQMLLSRFISEEYFTPLGNTLKHFFPKQVTAKKKTKEVFHKSGVFHLHKSDADTLKKFLSLKKESIGYLNIDSLKASDQFFSQLVKKMAMKKKQALILVPEIVLIPALENTLSQYFAQEKIAVLHSKLTAHTYSESWEKIRSGKASVIIATRQGLFAPFHSLGAIVVLEEQDEGYKQWNMSPRYDGRRIAKYLSSLYGAKLMLVSGTPSIDSLYHIAQKNYIPLSPLDILPPLAKKLSIVNLRLERFRKNYSPLSQELITALQETLCRGEQTLLYIHRQGMNAFSVCENCKHIFRCPQSGHVLSSTIDGGFRCNTCSYKTSSFPSCPHCGHLSFRHVGFGTERVEREIKKLFPRARVFRADATTLRTERNIQKFYTEASSGNIDILVGTQMVLKGHALPKLALIGMIDADSLLSFPDFRADEKLFQILMRFVKQSEKLEKKSSFPKIIVQTFHPESTFFQRITELDSEKFSRKILSEREELFYPPYSRLISIICHGKTEKRTLAATQKFGLELRKLFPKKQARYRLSNSESTKQLFTKKLFESSLLLRIPAPEPIPENIRLFLEKTNISHIIDVDPLSFS
jgi:primosomal protein N'